MTVYNRTPPAKFIRLYTDPNITAQEIARACGYTETQPIHRKAELLGLPRRRFSAGRRRVADPEKAIRLKALGATTRQIAAALGCSTTAIYNALKEQQS